MNKKSIIMVLLITFILITCLQTSFATDNDNLTTDTNIQNTTHSNNDNSINTNTITQNKENSKDNQKNTLNINSNEDNEKGYDTNSLNKNISKKENNNLKASSGYRVIVNSKTDYEGYVDITASVRDYYGNDANGGYVDFYSQGASLGYTTVNQGVASINRKLTEGTYTITATYSGIYSGTGTIKIIKNSSATSYTDYTPSYSKTYDIKFGTPEHN